jgi:hypothetical protein
LMSVETSSATRTGDCIRFSANRTAEDAGLGD